MSSPTVNALKDRLAAVKADLQRSQAHQNLRVGASPAITRATGGMVSPTRPSGGRSGSPVGQQSRLFTTPPPSWKPATNPDADRPPVSLLHSNRSSLIHQNPAVAASPLLLRDEVVQPPSTTRIHHVDPAAAALGSGAVVSPRDYYSQAPSPPIQYSPAVTAALISTGNVSAVDAVKYPRSDELYSVLARTGGMSPTAALGTKTKGESPLDQVLADLHTEALLKSRAEEGDQAKVDAAKAVLQMETILQERHLELHKAQERISELEGGKLATTVTDSKEAEEAKAAQLKAEEKLAQLEKEVEMERKATKTKFEGLELQLEELVTQLENSIQLSRDKQATIDDLNQENAALRAIRDKLAAVTPNQHRESSLAASSRASLGATSPMTNLAGKEVRFSANASSPSVVVRARTPMSPHTTRSTGSEGTTASTVETQLQSPRVTLPTPTTAVVPRDEGSLSQSSVVASRAGSNADAEADSKTMKRLGNLEDYLLAMTEAREEDKLERRRLLGSMAQMQTSLSEVTSTVCRLVASNPPSRTASPTQHSTPLTPRGVYIHPASAHSAAHAVATHSTSAMTTSANPTGYLSRSVSAHSGDGAKGPILSPPPKW